MTEQFRIFLDTTNKFLHADNFDALGYCDYVDQFWVDHEEDLEYSADPNDRNDENTIVSRIWELADRYDPCDEIVAHDPYCINAANLKKQLKEIIKSV